MFSAVLFLHESFLKSVLLSACREIKGPSLVCICLTCLFPLELNFPLACVFLYNLKDKLWRASGIFKRTGGVSVLFNPPYFHFRHLFAYFHCMGKVELYHLQ